MWGLLCYCVEGVQGQPYSVGEEAKEVRGKQLRGEGTASAKGLR